MSSQVDYRAIAGAIISAPKPAPRRSARKTSTERLDFNHEPVKGEDEFLPGYFPEETFIAHLESSVSVEKGEYNVLLYKPDPDPPSSFVEPTFLLSTNGWHPESEALRPAFLIHSYRLLLAVEEVLAAASSDAGDKKREVVAIYDCGEDSWVVEGHKSIRFYVIRANTTISESKSQITTAELPSSLSLSTPSADLATLFQGVLNDIVPSTPPYNLIFGREKVSVIRREKSCNGMMSELGEGRWDGARLAGLSVISIA